MTAQTVAPEDLDTTFVPQLRAQVATVPVADEAILYEADTGDLHRLDTIGTVVCQLFDGATPLTDLVDALADAFGASREVVEADVLTLTRELGRKGLLAGVAGEVDDASSTVVEPDEDVDRG